jgi:hypothetical protein
MSNSETSELKKKKTKGPVRGEAVVPLATIGVLVWAYFFFLFDRNLRFGLEYVSTLLNGAEVNVAKVQTSFIRAEAVIGRSRPLTLNA